MFSHVIPFWDFIIKCKTVTRIHDYTNCRQYETINYTHDEIIIIKETCYDMLFRLKFVSQTTIIKNTFIASSPSGTIFEQNCEIENITWIVK